jgi:methionine--tRNA ligase beta chain
MITFDDFQKIELKIGKILSAERVEGSEKLLKLTVDFAEEAGPRQVISGIAKQFTDPAALVGQKFTFITNLEPRSIMGLQSQAMILAASHDSALALLQPTIDIPEGTKLS